MRLSAEARVGLVVLLGVMVLTYMTFTVGGYRFGRETGYRLFALFDTVAGLDAKSGIKVAGVDVGKVETIALQDGQAKVTLRIKPEVKLRKGTQAAVRATGLLGEKYIELIPGKEEDYLKDGDALIESEKVADLDRLINQFSGVAADIKTVSESLREALGSEEGKQSLKEIVASIRELSRNLNVTVKDTVGPEITVPSKTVVEATGPHGAIVTFTVSATDAIDGPVAPPIPCTPASGSTFALGTTKVTCTANDSHGNTGTGTFDVVVQDTTPPRLNVPGPTTLSTPDGGPLPRTQPSIAVFLASPKADDLVDGAVPVTNDAPASFPVGTTTITFTTHDAAENTVSATSTITVVFTPAAPPLVPLPPDTTPPPDPARVTATAANRKVVISWRAPSAADLDHYIVEQSLRESPPALVYTGTATTYTAASLTNGVQYRFVVVSVDRVGNKSTGAVVTATPVAPMLVRPADGAVIATLPVLVWKAVPTAAYYNVQLYRMLSLSAVGGPKILSAWPVPTSLRLKQTWRYNDATYRLSPGVYRWFVWPGLGPRADGKYGQLLGSSAFVVRRTSTPPAKPKKKP